MDQAMNPRRSALHRVAKIRTALACTALLWAGAACHPATKEDMAEMKASLQELAKKVDAIDQRLRPVAQAPSRPPEDYAKVYDIDIAGAPSVGPKDAPVTLVLYSDFQCPYCASAEPVIKQLQEKYSDRMKFVYKHYPLPFHPAARPVAIASMAAQEQGKFWQFYEVAFKTSAEGKLDGSASAIEGYAKKAGLDLKRFKRDLKENSDKYEARVEKDMEEGSAVDVRGTPTLYLNGKKLDPTKRSVAGMSSVVEALLAEKKQG